MLRIPRILVLACLASGAAVSIAAADDRSTCGSVPPKSAAASACSRIIAAPGTSAHDRALAYTFRGTVFLNAGDNAHAIADFDSAVGLDPRNAKALYQRGVAKRGNGDANGGDADIAAAKALDPTIAGQP